MTEIRTVRAQTPTDLVALVPTVLGFHPQDSLVLLCVDGGGGMHARVDLPGPDTAEVADLVDHLESVVVGRGVRRVALLGYGAERDPVERVLVPLVAVLGEAGVEVPVCLRVGAGRWHPHDRDGFALEGAGTAYDLSDHPVTLDALLADRVVHADRTALADSLEPLADEVVARVAAAAATAAARPRDLAGLGFEARWLQRRVRRFVSDGAPFTDEELGRTLAVMGDLRVRDVAWAEMSRDTAAAHVRLWADAVRRAPAPLRAAPAALLAFAAWLAGDGALAWCAIDRCQDADPGYSMAGLVAQALHSAVPPSTWRPIPTSDLTVLSA